MTFLNEFKDYSCVIGRCESLANYVKKCHIYFIGTNDVFQSNDIVISYNTHITINNYYMS